MAGSVNKVILVGNVCNDPEVRSFNNGGKVANFSLATNESWRDKKTGERKEKAEFHKVAIMSDGLVSVVEKYVKKGSKLYIEGNLRTRKWQDRDGNDKYTTEIVLNGFSSTLTMLDGRQDNNSQGDYSHDQRQSSRAGAEESAENFDLDTEIPF